jgi:hypothetical protein
MSSNGVPLQDISDIVGHKSHPRDRDRLSASDCPAIRGGAAVMDSVFDNRDSVADTPDEQCQESRKCLGT